MKIDRNSKLKLQVFIMIIALVLQAVMPAMSSVSIAEPLTTEEAEEQSTEAVDAVKTLIGALPGKGKVTLEDEADIEEAREAYDELTDDDEELLEVEPLETAEAELEELELAEEEEELNSEDIESDDNAVESEEIDESEEEAKHETEKDADKKVDRSELDSNEEEDKKIEDLEEDKTEETVELPELDINFMPLMMNLLGAGTDLGSNIFTVVNLWKDRVGKEEGTVIEDGKPIDLDENTTITMRYDWNVQGKGAKSGDTASIKIPDIFDSAGSFPNAPIMLTDGTTQVGTWTISGGFLKFTFGEGIESVDQESLTGTFIEFGFKLNMAKISSDVKQTIQFGDSVNKTFNLTAKPDLANAKAISKVGVPNGTDAGNKKDAKVISWTIDVLNTTDDELMEVILSEDNIPDGLSLNTGSFKKTSLTMGLDGGKNTKGSKSSISDPSKGDGFEINLATIKPYSGYRIEYTTNIKDFSKTTFTNTAKIDKGADLPADLTASGTVGDLTRSAPLEKSGSAIANTDEIKWTIDVNKGGISIANPKLEDTLPPGLSIKEISGVKQVFVTRNGTPVATGVATSVSGQTLTVTLPTIAQNDIYKIVYTTVADYTQVNGGTYQKENTFTNSAFLYDGANKIGTEPVVATATATRKHLLYKDGSNPSTYGDTLSWTINVNQAYHTINNAVLHDTIPTGVEFNAADVKIEKKAKGGNFVELTEGDRPTVTELDGSRKATVTLGNITDEYKITYTTKMNNDGLAENASFSNNAYLTYNNQGTGVGSGTIDHPVNKTITPPSNTYTKEAGAINYDEKTIEWTIEINPRKDPITKLNIVDTFPNKGMIFLPDTFGITNATEGSYTLSANTEGGDTGYHKGFTIAFTDGTETDPILSGKKMTINYKTSFDPQRVVGGKVLEPYTGSGATEYLNQAVLKMKTKSGKEPTKIIIDKALNTTGTDSPAWNSGKKEGRRVHLDGGVLKDGWVSGKDRLIEWKIYTNYLNQDLGTDVTVTDTLAYDGSINLNSVKIKGYSVDSSGGGTTDGDTASIGYDKSLTNDDKTLSIKFGEKVDKRYVIIYNTTVPEKSQATYTNNAILTTVIEDAETEYPYDTSVSYSKSDSYITKSSTVSGTKAYTDDEIDWNIVINESLSTNMTGVVIEDKIAKGMAFKNGSLEIYRVEGTSEVKVTEGYTLEVDGDQNQPNGTKVTIAFNDPISHKYIIRYQTIVTATSGSVSNSAKVVGSHIVAGKTDGKSYTAEKFGFTGGDVTKGKIKITKVDEENNKITSPKAKFVLWYELNGTDVKFGDTEYETDNGEVEIVNLPLGRTYYLQEVKAPKGYALSDERSEIKNLKASSIETFTKNVINEKIKGKIEFDKVDEDGNALAGVTFTLYKGGSQVTTAISGSEGKVSFTDVEYGDYTIKETATLEGYILYDETLNASIGDDDNRKTVNPTLGADTVEEVTNVAIKGNLEIKKTDEDKQALAGAKFKLYKQDSEGNLGDAVQVSGVDIVATSEVNGIVKFENIPYGKYIIKESSAPDSYAPSTEEIKLSIVTDGTTVKPADGDLGSDVNPVINTKVIGDIQVKKLDEDGETGLAGAKFVLEQDGEVKYTSGETDEFGSYVFENIAYGKYDLKETEAPEGYNLINETQEVDVVEKGAIITKTFTNTKIRGDIKLKKVGESNNGLAGAVFTLYKEDGTTQSKDKDGNSITATSNADGEATFTGVAFGTYKIKETIAPTGYNLSDKVLDATITTQSQVVDLTADEENTVSNTNIRGNIEILKRNKSTHNPLANAKIAIYTKDDILIGEKTTAEDGKVNFDNLEYGEYYYQEKQAPSGYILDNLKYPFDIIENGVTIERELDNTRRPISPPLLPEEPGRVELTKIDSDDSNIKLEGAEFEIKDSNGSVVERITTNANGKATSSSLPMGAYSLVEITAPTAYKLNSTERSFVIDGSGVLIKLTIGNEKESEEATDPENPDKPDPEEPTDPENPDKPDPEEPTDPENPDKPDPEEPTDPKPTEPSNPGGSGGGGGGGGSKDSEKPVDPEKPIDSEDPEKPTDPSVDPENPVEPEEPGKPTEPERPTQPRPIDPIEEETPNNTPKEGKINVPKGATVKPSTPPKNGTVTIDPNGNWKYTPKPGFVGKDRFTITLTYEDGTTEEIEIIINVGDRKPTIIKSSTTKNVPKGGEVEVEKGDRLTITTPATNGSATVTNDGSWKYTPNTDYIGKDVFTITVTSQDGTEGQIIVEMTVTDGLPKTGEASNAGFYLTGLLFISLGLFLRKKKTV